MRLSSTVNLGVWDGDYIPATVSFTTTWEEGEEAKTGIRGISHSVNLMQLCLGGHSTLKLRGLKGKGNPASLTILVLGKPYLNKHPFRSGFLIHWPNPCVWTSLTCRATPCSLKHCLQKTAQPVVPRWGETLNRLSNSPARFTPRTRRRHNDPQSPGVRVTREVGGFSVATGQLTLATSG